MTIKPTLTIGIPAYNEENNIGKLILSLLRQKHDSWTLDNIVVYSDGSSDSTESIVRKIKRKSIKLIIGEKRVGQAMAQKHIIKYVKSDILVLLNADILPKSTEFISQLIAPLGKSNVGMTSARVDAMPGDSYFSKIIVWSHRIKSNLYATLAPSSVYLCHGRARALSRRFYTKLSFPKVVAEDAYSYFECLGLNYEFVYCPKAAVIFRAPSSFSDHILQSRRFLAGTRELSLYYPKSALGKEYHISFRKNAEVWFKALVQNPLFAVAYFIILGYSLITSTFMKSSTGAIWAPSPSSKKL